MKSRRELEAYRAIHK